MTGWRCGCPEVRDDIITGTIDIPMIGANKACAARNVMEELSVDPDNCFAYGDHLSDIDLLETVGNPGIVPHDPELVAVATARNWRIL